MKTAKTDDRGKRKEVDAKTKAEIVRRYLFDGKTQVELAKKAGISQGTISDWLKVCEANLRNVFESRHADVIEQKDKEAEKLRKKRLILESSLAQAEWDLFRAKQDLDKVITLYYGEKEEEPSISDLIEDLQDKRKKKEVKRRIKRKQLKIKEPKYTVKAVAAKAGVSKYIVDYILANAFFYEDTRKNPNADPADSLDDYIIGRSIADDAAFVRQCLDAQLNSKKAMAYVSLDDGAFHKLLDKIYDNANDSMYLAVAPQLCKHVKWLRDSAKANKENVNWYFHDEMMPEMMALKRILDEPL